jgi:hypothetical protein
MSAWGISNFENDSALDWVNNIIEQKEVSSLSGSIDKFIANFSIEETTLIECSVFLTVAETIAGLVGNPAEDFPDELKDWSETKYIKIEQITMDNAIKGIELILKDSEAKEMFLDSGYYTSWENAQTDLIKRLAE